jgi:hypothetical protein
VAEAIFQAVGVRLQELPMSPIKVLDALLTEQKAVFAETAAAD